MHLATHHATRHEEEDKRDFIMGIIQTTAPIPIEHLKEYFQDKNTRYIIDYGNSELKGEKLLVYLGNLDLPCDIIYADDASMYEMIAAYMKFTHIVNIESLERSAMDLIFQRKGVKELFTPEAVEDNVDIIDHWIKRLDSMTLYNMWTVDSDDFKDFVTSHPEDNTDSLIGINFVSLLKYPEFYDYFSIPIEESELTYYSRYFNDYMFKGNNLYSYWANENNPMFLLTWGIATGLITGDEYVACKNESIKELS